jgi:NAD(P)-dependent dehydrogenase (short-subunit alcohol dehydrogenase family)
MNNKHVAVTYRLDGRIAVVTGAAGAIGSAIATLLSACSAQVALLDLAASRDRLDALAASLPGKAIAVSCDVTDEGSVQAAVQQVERELGCCDILVNNAGVLPPHASLQDTTLEVWERTMAVNVRGPFLCTREFGRQMLAHGHGCIVNIGSVAAAKPNALPPYNVSKAAILALTRHTAVEWGPRGIRTNSVSPGFIMTPMSAVNYANEEQVKARIGMVPLRRLGTVDDIAQAVAYLASEGAAFVNGQDLLVDGGFLETPLMHAQPRSDQYGGYPG